jgi:hypothetical protein
MRIEIKDSTESVLVQDCDDYTYNVTTKTVLCYTMNGDKKELIAAYEDIKYFRKKVEVQEE